MLRVNQVWPRLGKIRWRKDCYMETTMYRKKKQKIYNYFFQKIDINVAIKYFERHSFNEWQQSAETVTIINSLNKKNQCWPHYENPLNISHNDIQKFGLLFKSKVFHFFGLEHAGWFTKISDKCWEGGGHICGDVIFE